MYLPPFSPTGFTLIEVLVVVAIIALLVAILVPSLSRARESAKRAACLSNLRQQGIGMNTYAMDHRNFFPIRTSFTYYIKYNSQLANYGLLYGKYVGKDINLFYCPGHMPAASGATNYQDYGPQRFANPPYGIIFGGYLYAAPVKEGFSPRNGSSKDVYTPAGVDPGKDSNGNPNPPGPDDVVGGIWNPFVREWLQTDPDHQPRWGGPKGTPQYYTNYRFPGMPALESDQYIKAGLVGGWMRNLHLNGMNVLYVDSHAKFVRNEGKPDLTKDATSGSGGAAQLYNVWEFFSRRY